MPGKLVHFELPAKDAARARAFWSGVFGWTFSDPGLGGEYWMTRTAEDQGGAVYLAAGEVRGAMVYFDTDDIQASIERARALGGSAEDRQPIPQIGWFARCSDTEGNAFGLFESDTSVGV
jgi:uncharacterized protein